MPRLRLVIKGEKDDTETRMLEREPSHPPGNQNRALNGSLMRSLEAVFVNISELRPFQRTENNIKKTEKTVPGCAISAEADGIRRKPNSGP